MALNFCPDRTTQSARTHMALTQAPAHTSMLYTIHNPQPKLKQIIGRGLNDRGKTGNPTENAVNHVVLVLQRTQQTI